MQESPKSQLGAAGLIIAASAFVAASTLCAKMLGTGDDALNPIQATWGRYVFGFFGLLLILKLVRPQFSSPKWPVHIFRIVTGVAGVYCMFTAAAHIPLADVTAMTFLNPVFVMIFAIPILGEKVGPIRWSMALLALLGALLLVRPGTEGFQPASLFALGAAVLFGMEIIVLKLLAGREGAFQIILIANALGALLASIAVIYVWSTPSPQQWLLMLGAGCLMVTAQGFYTNALRIGEASFVLPFSYSTLLFAALYDFFLFDVVPVPLSIAGGAIIILSGLMLAWRERQKEVLKQAR